MAKQRRIETTVHTPAASPTHTLVKVPPASDPVIDCYYGTICIRATIVDDETGELPDGVLAEVFREDPGDLANADFPKSPETTGHLGLTSDKWVGFNARWDHVGGSPVDNVACEPTGDRTDNFVVIWARWAAGGSWDPVTVVQVNGRKSTVTACE